MEPITHLWLLDAHRRSVLDRHDLPDQHAPARATRRRRARTRRDAG